MENEFEFKRGEKKYPVFLSHGIHLPVSYFNNKYLRVNVAITKCNATLRKYKGF